MLKRRLARVFSFIVVFALVFSMASSPAYAMSGQQFAAWIAAAISAINITVQSTFIPAADLGNKWNDYLSAPVLIEQGQVVDLPYTFSQNDIDEYLDRSVIKIDKDTVTIDGVEYSDVWLSNDAAEKFRVNAFDFENAFDIASQTEGTFVSGEGYFAGNPVFRFANNDYRTQIYGYTAAQSGTSSLGSIGINWEPYYSSYVRGKLIYNGVSQPGYIPTTGIGMSHTMQWNSPNKSSWFYKIDSGTNYNTGNAFVNDPFDFEWVAGTIPADEPLPSDVGLNIRVPTQIINQWYIDYPDTGDHVEYNMGDPEFTTQIEDLIDLLIPVIPILDIDYNTGYNPEPVPQPEPVPDPVPYPDPAPQPGTVIPDVDWTELFDTIRNIYNNISISNSWLESIKNLLDKIKWNLDDILDLIRTIPDIILEDIETGPLKIFDKILDLFKSIFLPFFLPLKLALTIWSYVTVWIQSLWATWETFRSILPFNIMVPIYGTFAAYVCISIYKKVIH